MRAAWGIGQGEQEHKVKKYIENDTAHTIYVSGLSIAPGEGREVDVPDQLAEAAAPAEPTIADQVALLLKASVGKITESLDALNGDTLDMMAELEGMADKPRSTLLAAIGAEKLKRSNATLEAQTETERAQQLDQATIDLQTAQTALDVEGDTDKHPALEAAVSEARARVEALSDPQA